MNCGEHVFIFDNWYNIIFQFISTQIVVPHFSSQHSVGIETTYIYAFVNIKLLYIHLIPMFFFYNSFYIQLNINHPQTKFEKKIQIYEYLDLFNQQRVRDFPPYGRE